MCHGSVIWTSGLGMGRRPDQEHSVEEEHETLFDTKLTQSAASSGCQRQTGKPVLYLERPNYMLS